MIWESKRCMRVCYGEYWEGLRQGSVGVVGVA